jgi:hypothetical protein
VNNSFAQSLSYRYNLWLPTAAAAQAALSGGNDMLNVRWMAPALVAGATLLAAVPAQANCGGDHEGGAGYREGHHDGQATMEYRVETAGENAQGWDHRSDGEGWNKGEHRERKMWRQSRQGGQHRRMMRNWSGQRHIRRQGPWPVLETFGERDPHVFVGFWPSRTWRQTEWPARPEWSEHRPRMQRMQGAELELDMRRDMELEMQREVELDMDGDVDVRVRTN